MAGKLPTGNMLIGILTSFHLVGIVFQVSVVRRTSQVFRSLRFRQTPSVSHCDCAFYNT